MAVELELGDNIATLDWANIVGAGTLLDGGYVGDLMTIARAHVEDAMQKSQITQAQAGEIYTAMIPSAYQHGMQFEMNKELTEEKISLTYSQRVQTNRKAL